jgi:hypothetical protein
MAIVRIFSNREEFDRSRVGARGAGRGGKDEGEGAVAAAAAEVRRSQVRGVAPRAPPPWREPPSPSPSPSSGGI